MNSAAPLSGVCGQRILAAASAVLRDPCAGNGRKFAEQELARRPNRHASADAHDPSILRSRYSFTVSIVIVSFNTRELLRECLQSLLAECARLPAGVTAEILVVDNASRDGSAQMAANEFARSAVPVRVIASRVNLGFGVANNVAMRSAEGRYLVLLNSDAFLDPGALALAVAHMDSDPAAAIGGARLVGRDGAPQPSARPFHSILGTALVFTGAPARLARPQFVVNLNGIDTPHAAAVDWVTGAFMILRREALAKTGLFDPAFFLYHEEVDLCRRAKAAGFRVMYWPDVVVTHFGGESSRTLDTHVFAESEAQVVLWRMRSTLLYFRKHHGWQAWLARWLEEAMYRFRQLRNFASRNPARRARSRQAGVLLGLMRQAWQETHGGRVSPPHPW